jgi:hypothetical protein
LPAKLFLSIAQNIQRSLCMYGPNPETKRSQPNNPEQKPREESRLRGRLAG